MMADFPHKFRGKSKGFKVARCRECMTSLTFLLFLAPSDLMLGEMSERMTSLTFLLSLAPSDLMLGEMSRLHNESDFSIVSGSQ